MARKQKAAVLMHKGPTRGIDIYAYFPEIKWNPSEDTRMCYSLTEGHGPCTPKYAEESTDAPEDDPTAKRVRKFLELEYPEVEIVDWKTATKKK